MKAIEIRLFADRLDAARDDTPRHLVGDISAAVIQLHYIASVLEKEAPSGETSKGPETPR